MAELWEVLKQLGFTAPGGQGAQNIADGEPSASHTRLAKADGWVDRDAIEQVDCFSLKPLSRAGCRSVRNRTVHKHRATRSTHGLWVLPKGAARC